jgi:hypothetical protein
LFVSLFDNNNKEMSEVEFMWSLFAFCILLVGILYAWILYATRAKWFTCQVRVVDVCRKSKPNHKGDGEVLKSFEVTVELTKPLAVPSHVRDVLRRERLSRFEVNTPFQVPNDLFYGDSKSVCEGDLGVLTVKYGMNMINVYFGIWSLVMDTEKKESESKKD